MSVIRSRCGTGQRSREVRALIAGALTLAATALASLAEAAIAFRSSSQFATGAYANSFSVSAPAGVMNGDVMVMTAAMQDSNASTVLNPPPGWTLVRKTYTEDTCPPAFGQVLYTWYRVANNEPASYTLSFPPTLNKLAVVGIQAYSGVDPVFPINAENGQTNCAASPNVTAPSISTTVANTWLVGGFALDAASPPPTYTPPPGMTERVDLSVPIPASEWVSLEVADELRAATGATGTRVAVATVGTHVSIGHLLALRPAATQVFYSVGTSASDLKLGGAGLTVTITGGAATFSVAQADNVGVGDAVTYNGSANVAYVSGRASPTQYTLTTATGGVPGNVVASDVNSIRRAFTSLRTAASNAGDGSHLNNYNLVTPNRQLNLACYADGVMSMADSLEVNIAGYTTGPSNYIRVFTPVSANEVGTSQRHRGVFGTGFQLTGSNSDMIQIDDDYVRIEGLTLLVGVSNNLNSWGGIWANPNAASDIRISHNILKGNVTDAAGRQAYGIGMGGAATDTTRVWNNVVYNFPMTLGNYAICITMDFGTAYVFNNTVYNCETGIRKWNGITGSNVRNNVSINDAFNAAFVDYRDLGVVPSALMSHNVSSDATAAGTGSQTGKNAYASYFVSTVAGAEDLHLRASSLALWGGSGMDLTPESVTYVTDDIDGGARIRPDMGADEFGSAASATGRMLVKSGRYVGNATPGRAIYVGFQPDAVIVKRVGPATDRWAMLRTSSMVGDATKDLDNAGFGLFPGVIQALTATGFTVGIDAGVNENTRDYHWVAFKAGDGDMKVGSYTGDASPTRSITGVGFQPDFVIVMPDLTADPGGIPVFASSSFPADTSFDFDATQRGPNCVKAFVADGFQVGTGNGVEPGPDLNAAGVTFHYVAWNATPGRVAVGSYTGNGAAPRDLDVTGFHPEWVIVKKFPDSTLERAPVNKPASTGVGTDQSLRFVDLTPTTNTIMGLRPLGFRVGNDERTNSATACGGGPCTYHYVAFGPHVGGVNYRSIGPATNYATGTVEATPGSTLVTGTGTAWRTANRGRGDRMVITGSSLGDYTVASVVSDTVLQLTTAYEGTPGSGKAFSLQRKFTHPSAWEDCVDGPLQATCGTLEAGATLVSSNSLVSDDRSEVGILYNDDGLDGDALPDPFVPLAGGQPVLGIGGAVTDATHTITLTVDPGNRHAGVAWSGAGGTPHVVFRNSVANSEPAIRLGDDFVTVEWLELRDSAPNTQAGFSLTGFSDAITPSNGSLSSTITLRNNLVHDLDMAFDIGQTSLVVDIYDNVVYRCRWFMRMEANQATDPSLIRVFNNSAYGCEAGFHVGPNANGRVLLRNNIAAGMTLNDDFWLLGTIHAASSHNLSEDATAGAASPAGGGQPSVALGPCPSCVSFVSTTVGAEDLHLQSTSWAIDRGTNLSSLFNTDIDAALRPAAWDIGADEFGATTAVRLQSLAAVPGDASVTLEWRTASELDNLGFHLYRATGELGPWTRLNQWLIPGLGSSAVGQAYAFRDTGLANGTRYFYRLEDVDASGKLTSHGPVSAVPQADGTTDDSARSRRGDTKQDTGSSCPDWVLSAYAATAGADSELASMRCTRHGDPEATSLGVVARDARSATVELLTGGFYALHRPGGAVRAFVPGFDFPEEPGALALPLRRALVDAVVGRRTELAGVRATALVSFRGLVPAALGQAVMAAGRDGTVRATRRAADVRATPAGGAMPVGVRNGSHAEAAPAEVRAASGLWARLLPSVFQGEAKSAVVALAPLRYDAQRRTLVLAKRLRVRLVFAGREAGESGRGRFGRAPGRTKPADGERLARFFTTARGLHAVAFEQVFADRARAVPAAELRLERQGQSAAFHLAPDAEWFGPGGRLFFFADRTAASTDFSGEVAFELVRGEGGLRMPVVSATPLGEAPAEPPLGSAAFETNRYYQPGLLDAPDPWLWEALPAGAVRARSFTLAGAVADAGALAELEVVLQGASESGRPVDHHMAVALNGVPVGEAQFAGKRPYRISLGVPAGVLREGTNELLITNVGDSGVSSYVFLDRFSLRYPEAASLSSGAFEGAWAESGSVALAGADAGTSVLDVTDADAGGVRWVAGFELVGDRLGFRAESGRRYLAVAPRSLLVPRVGRAERSTLRAATNQADWLLVAPRAFLPAAEPLLRQRVDQGFAVRAVAFEEIVSEFGRGQPSAEAIRDFLAFAFHSWARPSPRYVLLVGDSSYDPRNFTGTARPAPLPALWTKTSYLWTVSDPLLGAVNGSDSLPDLAVGRLPAATVEEAQALVAKLLAWEASGQRLDGRAALVADNPDSGGDFEANARDIAASFLLGRAELVLLRELGATTRPRIAEALDSGLSYLSYVGHGGAAVWASENVWNSWDAASLQAQSRQPLALTLNCLNGYFVAPSFDSLSESLVKAEGRGAIASISPSGLSLDGPAHQYHRALMAELASGRHARLGDAFLAAQRVYTETGIAPELVTVYHLLGDPALPIR